MTPAEIGAVSRLGSHAFADLVSRIEGVHQAIAGRAFAPAAPASAPARVIHDSVTRGVYLAGRDAGAAAGVLGERQRRFLASAASPLAVTREATWRSPR